jgi:tartrate-resistant acid phosphatase type 5
MRYILGIATAAIVLTVQSAALAVQTRFAVIGDYGVDTANQLAVANRVKAFAPDFITTTGDNTYFVGTTPATDFANWDKTQGKYYGDYIQLPTGSAYGTGATTNKFFPVLGNHDWDEGVASYSAYFNLPVNQATPTSGERYYSFIRGGVEFFMLDADPRESGTGFDGRAPGTTQYEWAKKAITSSTAAWQIVMFHQPAYTYVNSGHGSETAMRWAFQSWGVDAIFSGHVHDMQDMTLNDPATGNVGLPYFVQGSGGNSFYKISGNPSLATGNWYNDTSYGFSLVTADETSAKVEFYDTSGLLLNSRNLSQFAVTAVPEPATLPATLIGGAAVLALLRRRKRLKQK